MSLAVDIYHILPSPVASLAASARGAWLKNLRYGDDLDLIVADAAAREHATPVAWASYHADRLPFLLHHAARTVPFYRRMWRLRHHIGSGGSWLDLDSWPVLQKEDVRRSPATFMVDDAERSRLYHERTSGSTGTPVDLWFERSALRQWFGLYELRCRRWNGSTVDDSWAIIGAQPIVAASRRRPPYWIWNAGQRQLYLSSWHLSPDTAALYLDAMRRHEVTYVLAYTSSIHDLARMVMERDLHVPRLNYIMTNAEPLHLWQRRDIEHAFGCPVRENYGMTEAMVGASECEHGTLHLWPDAGVVELLHDDGSITNSGSGEVLGTTLHNRVMPLIRYRTGDRIDGLDPHASCACGRTLPVIRAIDGRRDDVIITPDGRRLGRLDPVFKDSLPIRKAQIVQVSQMELEVRLVPAEGYASADGDTLAHRISQLVGDMNIRIVLCTNIPSESNGKFKGVVNLLRT